MGRSQMVFGVTGIFSEVLGPYVLYGERMPRPCDVIMSWGEVSVGVELRTLALPGDLLNPRTSGIVTCQRASVTVQITLPGPLEWYWQ